MEKFSKLMKDKYRLLYNEDNVVAYHYLLELEALCDDSNELYCYFEEILNMLDSTNVYERVRGFRLICHLTKWDSNNLIDKNIYKILNELDIEKGAFVRNCLSKIYLILLYKPELSSIIEEKLKNMDLNKYKESMQCLILKDINDILNRL